MKQFPIFFIGFMASGKSSKGKKVAKRLGLTFVDLDKEIERGEEMTILQIFEERGETHFRELESEYLKSFKSGDAKLIALGGGTVCHSNNMEYLRGVGTSVYLKLSNELLLGRLRQKKKKRPLVANLSDGELKNFIASKMEERSIYYEQADLIIDADSFEIDQTVQSILSLKD